MAKRTAKLVSLVWVDACSTDTNRWTDNEELDDFELRKIITAGWLVRETDDLIIVVSQLEEGFYAGGIVIPKVCIKEITEHGKEVEFDVQE